MLFVWCSLSIESYPRHPLESYWYTGEFPKVSLQVSKGSENHTLEDCLKDLDPFNQPKGSLRIHMIALHQLESLACRRKLGLALCGIRRANQDRDVGIMTSRLGLYIQPLSQQNCFLEKSHLLKPQKELCCIISSSRYSSPVRTDTYTFIYTPKKARWKLYVTEPGFEPESMIRSRTRLDHPPWCCPAGNNLLLIKQLQ